MSSPISGFTAIPNPQMLAFMGAQSFVMMYQAGEGWQYGKRKISAMSNDEFNALTPERLLQNQAATLRNSISTIEKSMNDMTPMISTIIAQYGDFLREIIKATPSALKSGLGGTSPQAIIQNFTVSTEGHNHETEATTGEGRQLLTDFIKFITNPLPEASGHIEVIPTTTPTTTPTGGSRVIGPTENPPTSGPSKIYPPFKGVQGSKSFYGGPAPGQSGPRGFQPTGQGSTTAKINTLKANAINITNDMQRKLHMWRLPKSSGGYKYMLAQKARLTQIQADIVRLKTGR